MGKYLWKCSDCGNTDLERMHMDICLECFGEIYDAKDEEDDNEQEE